MYFCIEILGESAFHKFLLQSGWSGRDYLFHYNRHTDSHMRAYRHIGQYHAERVDMHKSANTWPLLGNLLPADRIEAHVFVDSGDSPCNPQNTSERSGARKVEGIAIDAMVAGHTVHSAGSVVESGGAAQASKTSQSRNRSILSCH